MAATIAQNCAAIARPRTFESLPRSPCLSSVHIAASEKRRPKTSSATWRWRPETTATHTRGGDGTKVDAVSSCGTNGISNVVVSDE